MEPIYVHENDIAIQGVVVGVLRKYYARSADPARRRRSPEGARVSAWGGDSGRA
jgi:hypothetical protein